MSETPETDAAADWYLSAAYSTDPDDRTVPLAVSRKLERERDEVQSTLSTIHRWIERNHPDGFIDSLSYSQNLERVADNWYDRLDIAERERDEAREQRDSLQALSQSLAEACVKLKAERDEAREDLENMQCQRDLAMTVLKRLEQERDEARAELDRHGWRLTS